MGSFLKKMNRLVENESFSQLMPVVEYLDDEEMFLLEEPALACMLICQPTAGCNNDIMSSLNAIYKTQMPDNTAIQVQLASTPDIEDALYGYRSLRGNRMMNQDRQKCEALSESIHQFFRQGTTEEINNSGFRFRNFEMWFTIKINIKDAVPTESEVEKLREIVDQVFSRLSFFSPFIASQKDYYRRMRVLLNMYDKGSWRQKAQHQEKEFRTQPLKELLLEPGKRVQVERDGISFRDSEDKECMYVKAHSITEMPENMFYGQMLNLVGDWEHGADGLYDGFIISLNLIVPNQDKQKGSFFKKRTFITNQAKGMLLKYVDQLGFQKEDYDAIDREITQEYSTILKYSLQIVTFSRSKQASVNFSKKLMGYYSRQNVKAVADNHFVLPFFLMNLPLGLHGIHELYSRRFNIGTSKLATFLTPHIASWKGNTAYPAFMLASRLGQVVNLDFYQSETNYNIYCAATSGAGKSFFAGYLINSMLGSGIKKHKDPDNAVDEFDDGAQAFVVDVGRSYEGVAAQYDDAKFLVFGQDMKYSMNPFPNVVDMFGKDGEANMIRSILKTMACPSGKVTDLQNAEILSCLQQLWVAKGNEATITDFGNLCLAHTEPEMVRFGKQLKPFMEGGVYGDFFSDKYPPVTYDSRLIVCELEELKSDPHLQVVVLMSLVVSIQKQMYLTGTKRRKVFLLDEGWQYLKDEGTEADMLRFFTEFLETGWRRFRKVNGCGALFTQSVMDAYQSNAGKAIIANSSWLLLMRQNDEAIDKLEKENAYSGSKSDFAMLRSLRTVKPQPGVNDEAFSEVYVRFEGQSQVCRLYTDRKTQLILTTNPDEKALRQTYMDRGMTLLEAVDAMLEDEAKAQMQSNRNRNKDAA